MAKTSQGMHWLTYQCLNCVQGLEEGDQLLAFSVVGQEGQAGRRETLLGQGQLSAKTIRKIHIIGMQGLVGKHLNI